MDNSFFFFLQVMVVNAIACFFMFKRFIAFVFIPIFVFLFVVSAPVKVYAFMGYDYEYYFYTNPDAFEDLTAKEKVYVTIDMLLAGEDYFINEMENTDSIFYETLVGVVRAAYMSTGILCSSLDSYGDILADWTDTLVGLVDSGDVYGDDEGNLVLSPDAVNTIRETYVDDYRIVSIDEFNTFTFGSFFGYEESDYDASTQTSDDLAQNTNMYTFFWNSDYWEDVQQSNMVFVPEIYPFYDYALLYDEGYYYFNEYNTYFLQAYVPASSASSGLWHIKRYCKSYYNSSSSQAGVLYYDGGDVTSDLLINKSSASATASSYFLFTDANIGVTVPNVSASSQMFYDQAGLISSSNTLYWNYLYDGYALSSTAYWPTFAYYNKGYFSYAITNSSGTVTQTQKSPASYSPSDGYAYYSSYYTGADSAYTRLIMLSKEVILEDDITGVIYTYNSGSDVAVSSDAIKDADDNDPDNSPSITLPNDTITYVINNYDQIVYEIEEDNSVTNVTNVINNYITVVSDDDDDDGDSSGSGSSSDSDGSDSGTILSWLQKIYSKLCSFYTDAMTYLSGIRSNTVEIKTYLYTVKNSVSDLYDLVNDLYDVVYWSFFYTYSGIYECVSYLSDLYDLVSAFPDFTAYFDEWSVYFARLSELDYMEPVYGYLGDLKEVLENINNLLVDLPDYSTVLSSIYERLNDLYLYFTADLWELLTNLNNFVVYLYEEVSAFPDTLVQLFSDYFMDSYYVSQTVFEIIRGDLDLLYQMLAGDTDSVLSNMQDSIDALADAIANITSEDSEVSLSGIKGHLKVIEALLTGIAALLAVDTITDLIDFADEELDDYLDNITDSIGEVTDAMTDVFPFCIPWDILAILALFAAEPEAPVFEWPFDFDRLGVHYTVTIDFSEYENIAMICRTILTCLFVVGLGYLTIRITGGSGGGGDED